ncbi:DUF4440 domain-containing protein [Pedobacter cryoconitis]|uniref:DUF4440 domain-containing protein n=1 Tax=Pedobacter cryoconitis TaxID=188932 RepID=A0A7X0J712_9SPHI|nr:hypothetical protein [Pedobacter cryoconitis]MBB6501990.1 hypothetical protein [Pedobacter cryoconitis]
MELATQAAAEIRLFIKNIEEWFRGDSTSDQATETLLLEKFRQDFIMVTPGGKAMDYKALAAWLPAVYGIKPDIRIELHEIATHYINDNCVLMTYTESQYREEGDNKRIASALFVKGEDGLAYWSHLQETWCP